MITHVRIQNFRSFVDAEVDLKPLSLVVGANGSGKSNLLRLFALAGEKAQWNGVEWQAPGKNWARHQNHLKDDGHFRIKFNSSSQFSGRLPYRESYGPVLVFSAEPAWTQLPLFNLDPATISAVEPAIPNARVASNGYGTTQVLDVLKNGDREDLFDQIEENFCRCVPEVEKLSLRTVGKGEKQIQVRERGLSSPTAAPELSEGTRLILAILTIIHQEEPPPIILLEDIDRGMHPRLFESIAPLMRDIAERHGINILATTHNPYLVDCFQDHQDAVIIVEKVSGESKLSTLASKLEGLDYDKENPEDMPLGSLWYSGLVGGVPTKDSLRPTATS